MDDPSEIYPALHSAERVAPPAERATPVHSRLSRRKTAHPRRQRTSLALSSFACILTLLAAACGCNGHLLHGPGHGAQPLLQNPLFLPAGDSDFVWSQVVDALDNHFRIMREQRVGVVGNVPIEGFIETFPMDGSTILEPWRKDSTHGFEKLHSTLQSVRRRAVVRVVPVDGGHIVDVTVYKELEDLERPEQANVVRPGLRYQESGAMEEQPAWEDARTLGWIELGRDVSLEQRILSDISQRLAR
jgi:hypothetical protein